ncbi:MAG: fibronectin type III domain-containing protein [Ruminococcus sp.]|nr:fibronectin type III domain-containing protein [Ruminococcus sp.]
MKRKLSAILITIVITLNFVLSAGLSAFGASQTLAAPKLTLKSYATKAVLSWDKNTKADGYQIYWCGGDTNSVPHNNQSGDCWNERTKLKTISVNTTTSFTKTDLSYKKNYHFKVRAYKKSGSTTIYSGWSNEECTIDTVNRLNAASLKTKNSYQIINTQGSKNTSSVYTLTSEEKTILANFAKKHFTSSMTAGEKVVYTAEWIRNNMTYGPIPTNSHSKNIFVKKQGQCSDYNGALVEMMIYLGFDARLIMGYRSYGGQHFWGEVIIDGSVFLMEVGEKASDSPQWGYKWEFLCNTYSEADGGYYKNGSAAKDSIASYPSVVTGLKVSSKTIDTINLSWTKVKDAAGYYIYQYNNSQKKWVKIQRTTTTANTYKISKLSAGTEYKFAVKAYKTANGQEISSVSYPTLTVVTNPAAVKGFKTSSSSADYVNLSWDKVKSAQGYIIYQYDNSKKTWNRITKTTTTANDYRVTGLSAGTQYEFAVKAYRTENGKEVSSPTYPTLNIITNPPTVTGFKVSSVSANSVKLSWNKAKSAQGYIIYQYNNSKKTWSKIEKTVNTSNSYTVTGLESGVEYKFAVRAYRIDDSKTVLSPSYPQASSVTKLSKVSGIKSSCSDSSVKLSWNKVSGAQGYIVYQYVNQKWTRLDKITGTSYNVKNLASGKTYWFAVKAYKNVGGKEVASVSYDTYKTTTKPAKVDFTLTSGTGKATLKWNKVSGATGYIVYYKTSAKGSWQKLKTTTGTSYSKTGLSKGKTYYFTVKAYKDYNEVTYNGAYTEKSVKIK